MQILKEFWRQSLTLLRHHHSLTNKYFLDICCAPARRKIICRKRIFVLLLSEHSRHSLYLWIHSMPCPGLGPIFSLGDAQLYIHNEKWASQFNNTPWQMIFRNYWKEKRNTHTWDYEILQRVKIKFQTLSETESFSCFPLT